MTLEVNFFKRLLPIADLLIAPFVVPAALLLKGLRIAGLHRLPLAKRILIGVGVFPIRDHYYEPQFDNRTPSKSFSKDRDLPGIDWNVAEQLSLLEKFSFSDELAYLPPTKPASLGFYFNNGAFESGDAEYWYQLIRYVKPRRIIEIGSGHSTLMASAAVLKNQEDLPDRPCDVICVEPYEMPWLEQTGVTVIRSKVEDMDVSFFAKLEENDILFIDSSHVIRPQGDVLFEYLELLPTLRKGVIVHVHDIFSPKNYLAGWLTGEVKFWNEQYLLEAFLSHNKAWKVIGALNYLRHHHFEELKRVAPFLSSDREPGSFYMQKIA